MSDDTPDKDQTEQSAEQPEGQPEGRGERRTEGRTTGQRRGAQTFEGLGSLRQALATARTAARRGPGAGRGGRRAGRGAARCRVVAPRWPGRGREPKAQEKASTPPAARHAIQRGLERFSAEGGRRYAKVAQRLIRLRVLCV